MGARRTAPLGSHAGKTAGSTPRRCRPRTSEAARSGEESHKNLGELKKPGTWPRSYPDRALIPLSVETSHHAIKTLARLREDGANLSRSPELYEHFLFF